MSLVRDIMSTPVVTVREDTPLADVAALMLERRIGCLPVVAADGRALGIVTESDFGARARYFPFSRERAPQLFGEWMTRGHVEEDYAAAGTRPVSAIMTPHLMTVCEDDSIESAIERLLETGLVRLPVLRDGVPVGIIARHDLLKLMRARGVPPPRPDQSRSAKTT